MKTRWPRGVEEVSLGHVSDEREGNGRMRSENVARDLRAAGIPARREEGSYHGYSLLSVPRGFVTRARKIVGKTT